MLFAAVEQNTLILQIGQFAGKTFFWKVVKKEKPKKSGTAWFDERTRAHSERVKQLSAQLTRISIDRFEKQTYHDGCEVYFARGPIRPIRE